MTTKELQNYATKLGYKLVDTTKNKFGDVLLCYSLGKGTMQWFRVFEDGVFDYAMWYQSYSQITGKTKKTRSEAAWRLCLGA